MACAHRKYADANANAARVALRTLRRCTRTAKSLLNNPHFKPALPPAQLMYAAPGLCPLSTIAPVRVKAPLGPRSATGHAPRATQTARAA